MVKIAKGLVLLLVSIAGSSHAEIRVNDDHDRLVVLQKPASRIVSLAPHITETLFAAGAGNRIIATVSYSDYPEAAKKILRVGGYPSLDIERIVALKPDLVIAWASGNNQQQIEQLMAMGLTVFLSEPRYPLDIADSIRRFGQMAGTGQLANTVADDFEQHYQRLQQRFSNKRKVRVFYQIWNKPIMTVNGEHLISRIVSLCGGVNVFASLTALTPTVSLEAVIASRAEAIVSGGMNESRPDWLDDWKRWPQLPAAANNYLFYIDPSLLQRVGPRMLQGADKLCIMLDKVRGR